MDFITNQPLFSLCSLFVSNGLLRSETQTQENLWTSVGESSERAMGQTIKRPEELSRRPAHDESFVASGSWSFVVWLIEEERHELTTDLKSISSSDRNEIFSKV